MKTYFIKFIFILTFTIAGSYLFINYPTQKIEKYYFSAHPMEKMIEVSYRFYKANNERVVNGNFMVKYEPDWELGLKIFLISFTSLLFVLTINELWIARKNRKATFTRINE